MKNFKPNDNFVYYLYWICERMNIFWKRKEGGVSPYSNDPILNEYKFTNVYRCLDRASQYLLKDVIYNNKTYSKKDMFFRILLFKHFNLPFTWKMLMEEFGDLTLDTGFDNISNFLSIKQDEGHKIYSNAYMLTASFMRNEKIMSKYNIKAGSKKHEAYMKIFETGIFGNGLIDDMIESESCEELFNKFESVITVGKFLAMQYSVDMGYSPLFNFKDDFIIAGPGAEKGILRTFDKEGKPDFAEIIKWVSENFKDLIEQYSIKFDIPLLFRELPNHPMQLIDIQNCFCETDKYLRGSGIETEGVKISGSRIKNYFVESKNKIDYVFPPKWNVIIK